MSRNGKAVRIRRTPDESGDLVGSREAAEILGVERTRIARYKRMGWMPEPVADLRATPVWLRSEVVALRDRLREEHASKDHAPT